VEAIVNAAGAILGERPNASVEEIAATAGVTRQTVYAHFPSRDALVGAIMESAAAEALRAIDAAQIDAQPPAEALMGFLDIGWQLLRRYLPLILNSTLRHPPRLDGNDAASSFVRRLERIIQRGQRAGDFDRALPATWLAAAILRLGHTAAEDVERGRLTSRKAMALLRESAMRLCGAAGNPR
jgi:AcrR family transcriptional regulator